MVALLYKAMEEGRAVRWTAFMRGYLMMPVRAAREGVRRSATSEPVKASLILLCLRKGSAGSSKTALAPFAGLSVHSSSALC